jgi:hypothetical protein
MASTQTLRSSKEGWAFSSSYLYSHVLHLSSS